MANSSPTIYGWFFNRIARLNQSLGINQSIAKKIKSGYALALGTAVFGTGCGLLGSHYYAEPARVQAYQIQQQRQLLSDFNSRLLSIQTHPLRLLAIAGDSLIWMEYETNQFNTDLRQLNHLLDDIEALANTSSQSDETLLYLVKQYRNTLRSYDAFSRSLWADLDNIHDKQAAAETLSSALSSERASNISTAFEQLSEDLTRLKQAANQDYEQASAKLTQVEHVRLIIILSSMATSIGLAIVLAALTGRAIAQPIENLTQIARRVTQDNDFQLQAPLQTRDEVSCLAKALNQLVSSVGQYTADLEEAQQTLEQRVVERTQALQQSETSLRQQTKDLQQALNELQQAQLQLIQNEKMSSLGQLVAGVAHEINNPISFIHGNLKHANNYTQEIMHLLDLYRSSYPQPNVEIQTAIENIDLPFLQTDWPKLMQSMQDGTTRIRDIVQSLRTFSRLDEATFKLVNLHDGLDSTLTILNSRLKATAAIPEIKVIRNYGHLPLVECYAGQINQVFMNILSNAIDACHIVPTASPPTITITTQSLDPDWISIHISDNGPGIAHNVSSRLFDPFFTTKPVGQGTGLGLSISYQIVTEKHNGHLSCDSKPGEGAQFIIKLPVKLSTPLKS